MKYLLLCVAVACATVVPENISGTSTLAIAASNEDLAVTVVAKASMPEPEAKKPRAVERPFGPYTESLKPRYLNFDTPIGRMVEPKSRVVRLRQINVVSRRASHQNVGPNGSEVAEEIMTQVMIKGAAFAAGPFGIPAGMFTCHFLRFSQMVRQAEKDREIWTNDDHMKNWLLVGYRCSPLGFIEQLQNATNGLEAMSILVGGIANVAPLPNGATIPVAIVGNAGPFLRTPAPPKAHTNKPSAKKQKVMAKAGH